VLLAHLGSTLSPQTGWSLWCAWCHNLSDECLATRTFGQEITCPCLCVSAPKHACVFSSQFSSRWCFLDWCLSLGTGRRGSAVERGLIMYRGLVVQTWAVQLSHWSRCSQCSISLLRHTHSYTCTHIQRIQNRSEVLDHVWLSQNLSFWTGR